MYVIEVLYIFEGVSCQDLLSLHLHVGSFLSPRYLPSERSWTLLAWPTHLSLTLGNGWEMLANSQPDGGKALKALASLVKQKQTSKAW